MKLKNLCKVIKINKNNESILKAGMIGIVAAGVNLGKVYILPEDSNNMYTIGVDSEQKFVSNEQLCKILQSKDLISFAKGSTLPKIHLSDIRELDLSI